MVDEMDVIPTSPKLDWPEGVEVVTKGRRRKKRLYDTILKQMEFYFGDANLSKDRFLGQLVSEDPFVDLSVFLKFNKIRNLTDKVEDIVKALRNSTFLALSDDETKVRRITQVKIRENLDDCTIYVERIPPDMTHESLTKIFSQFGTVQYVSIPKYKHNKSIKGFAFIEFESEESAKKTLEHFASIGCKLPSQMPPDKLYSVATFEAEGEIKPPEEAKVDEVENVSEDVSEETPAKRIKLDENNAEVVEETAEIVTDEKSEKKRRRRNKTVIKRDASMEIKEMGLQVLSKLEWKRLRNKYLDLQRQKMGGIKKKMLQARFSRGLNQQTESETLQPEKPQMETETTKKGFTLEPGTVVRVEFPEPCDVKHFKSEIKEIKSCGEYIKYVDAHTGCLEAYVRFLTPEAATKFTESSYAAHMEVLMGEAHQRYLEKAILDRDNNFKRAAALPKLRGRDHVLRKAEKALGKHIRFDAE